MKLHASALLMEDSWSWKQMLRSVSPPIIESFFPAKLNSSTGVCVSGAQVFLRAGFWESPLSSTNTMVRLSCRALCGQRCPFHSH